MNLEIEKKYRLPAERVDALVTRLSELGAVFEGEEFEENTIYGGGILDREGGVVRIRKTDRRSLLTFKRRLENDSDMKRQVEYETEVSDPNKTDKIIRELGISPRLVYEKRRKTWRLGTTDVVIDQLPFGLYMEIEGEIESIRDAEDRLGIADIEVEHETYPSLTLRLGQPVGEVIEARFIAPERSV